MNNSTLSVPGLPSEPEEAWPQDTAEVAFKRCNVNPGRLVIGL